MGLGKPQPSEPISLPTAAFQQGRVDRHLFALCLGHDGGYFSIGGYNETLHLEDPVFLPYSGGALFSLHLSQVLVWDQAIDLDSPTVVDSGTTIFQMPTSLFEQIKAALLAFCKREDSFCHGKHDES